MQVLQVTLLAALGLGLAAGGSAFAFWRLQPPPAPSPIIYGSGRIEAGEVRVGFELPGRLLENRIVEGGGRAARAGRASIDRGDVELLAGQAAAQRAAALQTKAQVVSQVGPARHQAATARTDFARHETLSLEGDAPAQHLDAVCNAYPGASNQVGLIEARQAEAIRPQLVGLPGATLGLRPQPSFRGSICD